MPDPRDPSSGPSSHDPPRPQALRVAGHAAHWLPPGVSLHLHGHEIHGGMLYVGSGLPAAAAWGGTEPALVDPRLPVERDPRATLAAEAPYWPSYAEVTPAFRAKYLRWLAGGRRDPGVDLGCVFLFFYGIERRILLDAETDARAAAEVPALLAEVERLLDVYGEDGSFGGYADSLLELASLRHGLAEPEAGEPPSGRTGFDLPFGLRVALGRLAAARAPIPAEWALAWLRASPLVSLRTPATRCPAEFETLFRRRYRERFGEGMVLKPNRTPLSLAYGPASASFGGQEFRLTLDGIPDVGVLQAPLDRLRAVAEAATEALDRYSRWVGRGGEAESLAALSLLPAELLRARVRRLVPPLVVELANALGPDGRGSLPTATLLRHWPGQKPDRLSRKEAEGLTEFLEKLGLGIAPDVRHTGINPSQSEAAAVFLLPTEAPEPGPDLAAATLLLTLAAAVAGADEIARAEEEQIERHLESAYHLGPADRARLRAHLAWLRACPPGTTGLKKQVEPLPPERRAGIARALVAIAGADGHVSAAEVKMLSRLYPLLGLDAKQVYADVHALAAGSAPVPILPADPAADYAIPRPPAGPEAVPAAPAPPAFVLDTARIAAIQHDTREVTRVLAAVFAGEDEAGEAPAAAVEAPPEPGEDAAPPAGDRLPGLDAAHSALVRALEDRLAWPLAEFAAVAERHGLLAAGAIETINDAAFQLCDEPLLEGHDPVEVNPYAREELFA